MAHAAITALLIAILLQTTGAPAPVSGGKLIVDIIILAYNEEHRFRPEPFAAFALESAKAAGSLSDEQD